MSKYSLDSKLTTLSYSQNKSLWFWLGLLLLMALMMGGSTWYYFIEKQDILDEERQVQLELAYATEEAAFVLFDKKFHHAEDLARVLSKTELTRAFAVNQPAAIKQRIEDRWSLLLANSNAYTQLRYIDIKGQELIRVNFDPETGIVDLAESLQNKANRDYMKLASKLEPDQIALSAFDFEKENGHYVYPLQQAGRLISPVDFNGQRYGYIVINMNMNDFYDQFKLLNVISDLPFMVSSHNGNCLFAQTGCELQEVQLKQQLTSQWPNILQQPQGRVALESSELVYTWFDFSNGEHLTDRLHSKVLFTAQIKDEFITSLAEKDVQKALRNFYFRLAVIVLVYVIIIINAQRWVSHLQTQKLLLRAFGTMSSVIILDSKGKIVGVNQAFTELLGFSRHAVVGGAPNMLVSVEEQEDFWTFITTQINSAGRWQGEVKAYNHSGEEIMLWLEINTVKGKTQLDRQVYFVINFIDITKQKNHAKRLEALSSTDVLTGSFNRRYFDSEFKKMINNAKRYGNSYFTLAILDLDHFKQVNDKHGHLIGDEVLKRVAQSCQSLLRETDCFCRLGGEEFAILMPQTNTDAALVVCNRIREHIKSEFDLDYGVTCSIGLCEYRTEMTHDQVFKMADKALYKAKAAGRNKVLHMQAEVEAPA